MGDDQSCQGAVARVIADCSSDGKDTPSANTSAYVQARSRLPEFAISELTRQSGAEMEDQAKSDWLWRNRHVKLADGSTVSMPDTLENQAAYPQPDSQLPGCGFPISRLVAIISCATGAVLDLAMGPYSGKETGEHALLRQIMHNFKKNDVMLGDAYYCTFFLIATLNKLGVDAVFPIHGARTPDFRSGTRLGKRDHLVVWEKPQRPSWMDQETYSSFPSVITVREIQLSLENNGFRSESMILVTTFLNPKQVTKSDLQFLYNKRWLVEICLLSIKQTMHMDILRGKTPEIVRKEVWVHLLGYNLLRKVMAQAAHLHEKRPNQLSFKLALQLITSFRERGIFSEKNQKCYETLLRAIASRTIGNRPGRSEPRKVKRRPKAFPRLNKPRSFFRRKVRAA